MINHPSTRPVLIAALALTISVLASAGPALAQSAASDGQKLAFDRGKGNCLTCHVIKGGDLPGTIGPELKNIKSKYPDRNDLVAIITDETKRNPQTVMPPFGRNRILTEQEDAVKALYGKTAEASDMVKMDAPEIAENGAVVPISVSSTLADVTSIAILVAENPNALAASYQIPAGTLPSVASRLKMAKTTNVIAIVEAGGKLYSTSKEVKVTVGGCGG